MGGVGISVIQKKQNNYVLLGKDWKLQKTFYFWKGKKGRVVSTYEVHMNVISPTKKESVLNKWWNFSHTVSVCAVVQQKPEPETLQVIFLAFSLYATLNRPEKCTGLISFCAKNRQKNSFWWGDQTSIYERNKAWTSLFRSEGYLFSTFAQHTRRNFSDDGFFLMGTIGGDDGQSGNNYRASK